jgi:hypothetical protein
MEVAARSADAGQIPHFGGHGDLVPPDRLIRAMPGAHPITSIATLNLKDLKDFAGHRGLRLPEPSLRQARATGPVASVCGECGRGGDSSRACPAARARERLPRVPSAR